MQVSGDTTGTTLSAVVNSDRSFDCPGTWAAGLLSCTIPSWVPFHSTLMFHTTVGGATSADSGDARFDLEEDFTLKENLARFGKAGGSGTVTVTATYSGAVPILHSSSTAWLKLGKLTTSGSVSTLQFTVLPWDAPTKPVRGGSINLGEKIFGVLQESGS